VINQSREQREDQRATIFDVFHAANKRKREREREKQGEMEIERERERMRACGETKLKRV